MSLNYCSMKRKGLVTGRLKVRGLGASPIGRRAFLAAFVCGGGVL